MAVLQLSNLNHLGLPTAWWLASAVKIDQIPVMFGIKNLQRGLTVNFASLEPADEDPQLRPVNLPQLPEIIADRIESWASDRKGWSVVSSQNASDSRAASSQAASSQQATDQEIQIHLTRTTRLFRFVDDIRVTLNREGQGTRIDATSQSRLGKGDLGQNPRNLKEFTQMLRGL
ncbi:MAG: DUF1499 domain-containing protein [Rubripirellula sp.]|nr:DUF1499 domain-containing protein [Rubripirellula sp.]